MMDRNTTAALALSASILGVWAFTGGNETLAESSVRNRPLLRAAYAGEVDEVKRRISSGANVNEQGPIGVKSAPQWVSLETNMACGVGSCHGCAIIMADGRIARVCHDGPVFTGPALYGETAQ